MVEVYYQYEKEDIPLFFMRIPLLGFWTEDWIIDECENMKWDGGFYREKRVTWTRA